MDIHQRFESGCLPSRGISILYWPWHELHSPFQIFDTSDRVVRLLLRNVPDDLYRLLQDPHQQEDVTGTHTAMYRQIFVDQEGRDIPVRHILGHDVRSQSG